LGQDFETIRESEVDMGLGNGGLGRLAACFLDSLATLDYPALGYGIYYEFGLFKQAFVNGHQIEHPDNWIIFGDPWEIVRPEYTQQVRLYGRVENVFDDRGNYRSRWVDTKTILGVPHDIPIAGFGTQTVNLLRLWASKATEDFDLAAFNSGGYVEAVREKVIGETVSKVLYPNDKSEAGKELRLVQQYFFVACSLRDILRRHFRTPGNSWENFADKGRGAAERHASGNFDRRADADSHGRALHQLGDGVGDRDTDIRLHESHPVARGAREMGRLTLRASAAATSSNHLRHQRASHAAPRGEMARDNDKKRVCSLIEEHHGRAVRMANLAVVGSHAVNGVAALHTALLKKHLFPEFDALYPGKFQNKTNGITPRRWLLKSNPRLATLITRKLGTGWPRDLDQLRGLEKFADDAEFQQEFMAIKRENKVDLAAVIMAECGVSVSPDALFDVQIKRLHEYKRQHLNLLHIMALYRRLLQNPTLEIVPRVFIFAAKAAPGYDLAKNIIRAIIWSAHGSMATRGLAES
jgi:starch phosphorylase